MEQTFILVISDTHVGSKYAIWPEDFEGKPPTNQKLPPTGISKQLLTSWKKLLAHPQLAGGIDYIVHCGDIIDGLGRAKYGRELYTTDLDEQRDAAIQLLAPLTDRCKSAPFFLEGSGYHNVAYEDAERGVAQELGGIYVANYPLDLNVHGIRFNFYHGEGEATQYRSTKADRESLFALASASCGKTTRPQFIIRGHLHYFGLIEYESQNIINMPCWQAQTPYMAQKSYFRMQPDIGAYALCVIHDGNENGVIKYRYIYPAPIISREFSEYSSFETGRTSTSAVLREITNRPGISLRELMVKTGYSQNTVLNATLRLQLAGLIYANERRRGYFPIPPRISAATIPENAIDRLITNERQFATERASLATEDTTRPEPSHAVPRPMTEVRRE